MEIDHSSFSNSFFEDRSTFGSFVIVSSPLVLSFDLLNDTTLSRVWPIISNKEVLAINQLWAGEAGRLVRTIPTTGSGAYNNTAKDGTYAAGSYVWTVDCDAPLPDNAGAAGAEPAWTYAAATGHVPTSITH